MTAKGNRDERYTALSAHSHLKDREPSLWPHKIPQELWKEAKQRWHGTTHILLFFMTCNHWWYRGRTLQSHAMRRLLRARTKHAEEKTLQSSVFPHHVRPGLCLECVFYHDQFLLYSRVSMDVKAMVTVNKTWWLVNFCPVTLTFFLRHWSVFSLEQFCIYRKVARVLQRVPNTWT